MTSELAASGMMRRPRGRSSARRRDRYVTVIDADVAMACGDSMLVCCCCCRNEEVVSGVREETPGIANR